MTERELLRTILLLTGVIAVIVVIGFIAFVRWSAVERTKRQRDIELAMASRDQRDLE